MSFCSFLTFPFHWVTEIEIIERIARVLVHRKHLASRIVNANHGILSSGAIREKILARIAAAAIERKLSRRLGVRFTPL